MRRTTSEVRHSERRRTELHARYLQGLAEAATQAANTTIEESAARKSVLSVATTLEAECQISEKPKPNVVLDALVNHHVLVREREPAGYSFQHQQFPGMVCLQSCRRSDDGGTRMSKRPEQP